MTLLSVDNQAGNKCCNSFIIFHFVKFEVVSCGFSFGFIISAHKESSFYYTK